MIINEKNILNLSHLRQLRLNDIPYRWGVSLGLISGKVQSKLLSAWPPDGFIVNRRKEGSDKSYCIAIRSLLETGDSFRPIPDLSPIWNNLIAELASDAYRQAISEITQLDLESAFLEIVLNEYRPGFFLSPHTDKYPKLATQLFYFSENWEESWGGQLSILDERHRCAHRILPSTGTSVIIVRGENSWHEVVPVRSESKGIRRSLQVVFWAGKAITLPGRITY